MDRNPVDLYIIFGLITYHLNNSANRILAFSIQISDSVLNFIKHSLKLPRKKGTVWSISDVSEDRYTSDLSVFHYNYYYFFFGKEKSSMITSNALDTSAIYKET